MSNVETDRPSNPLRRHGPPTGRPPEAASAFASRVLAGGAADDIDLALRAAIADVLERSGGRSALAAAGGTG